jgi:predicted RNase H-like HicB family nuclease
MRYLVNIIYDLEYKGYVADVPELPGCMSQGKNVDAALENIREAIGLYLESTPPRKRSKPRTVLTATVEV